MPAPPDSVCLEQMSPGAGVGAGRRSICSQQGRPLSTHQQTMHKLGAPHECGEGAQLLGQRQEHLILIVDGVCGWAGRWLSPGSPLWTSPRHARVTEKRRRPRYGRLHAPHATPQALKVTFLLLSSMPHKCFSGPLSHWVSPLQTRHSKHHGPPPAFQGQALSPRSCSRPLMPGTERGPPTAPTILSLEPHCTCEEGQKLTASTFDP